MPAGRRSPSPASTRSARRGVECLRSYRTEWDEKARAFKLTPAHNWASHGGRRRRRIGGHGTGFPKSYAKLRRRRAAERRPGATKRADGQVGLREAALLLFQFLVAMTLVGFDLARQRNVSIEGQVGY